tara:strand:+ start:13007 stop:13621 length:615 start_codon:yes stop_codon:yes gene_type:complete
MLDRHIRPLIDPPLDRLGAGLAQAGVTANAVTLLGLISGILAGFAIGYQAYGLALALIVASRLADGLDGAIARATVPSDIGSYFDIVADFVFYAAIPLGFVWADPAANGLVGAALLGSFYINGASFLGFAILAEKHQLSTAARGRKSWYHSGGLLEGTETIALFVAFNLFPAAFVPLAWAFTGLCLFTAAGRVAMAWDLFRDQG